MQSIKSIHSLVLIFCLLTAFTTIAIFIHQRGHAPIVGNIKSPAPFMINGYILYDFTVRSGPINTSMINGYIFNNSITGMGPISKILSIGGYNVNILAGQGGWEGTEWKKSLLPL